MKIALGLNVGIKHVSTLRTFVEGSARSIVTWRVVPAPKGPPGCLPLMLRPAEKPVFGPA